MLKKYFIDNKVKVIISITFIVMSIFSLFFSNFIDNKIIAPIFESRSMFNKNGELFVHFINVGEGDAICINFPNGKTGIIDTGTTYSTNDVIKYIDNKVLNNSQSKVIDYLFLTHADSDHIGGASAILQKYKVKNVYRSRQYVLSENTTDLNSQIVDTDLYKNVVDSIYKENANFYVATNGMIFDIGDVILKIFYPLERFTESNDYSYFIKLYYKGKSILFTGDATASLENKMINLYGEELNCDILKVAHHGADTSTSNAFVNITSPKIAIISVGVNNFGHPASVVYDTLNANNVKSIYRTDKHGNILINIDENINIYHGNYYFYAGVKWLKVVTLLNMVIVCSYVSVIYSTIYKQKKRNKYKTKKVLD